MLELLSNLEWKQEKYFWSAYHLPCNHQRVRKFFRPQSFLNTTKHKVKPNEDWKQYSQKCIIVTRFKKYTIHTSLKVRNKRYTVQRKCWSYPPYFPLRLCGEKAREKRVTLKFFMWKNVKIVSETRQYLCSHDTHFFALVLAYSVNFHRKLFSLKSCVQ